MGYEEAQQGSEARTAFRLAEKRYKRYKEQGSSGKRQGKSRVRRKEAPPTDLADVIDFRTCHEDAHLGHPDSHVQLLGRAGPGYHQPIFVLTNHPGFFFLPGALPVQQQAHLIRQSLERYPEPPNRTNHSAAYGQVAGLWEASLRGHVLVQAEVAEQHAERQLAAEEGKAVPNALPAHEDASPACQLEGQVTASGAPSGAEKSGPTGGASSAVASSSAAACLADHAATSAESGAREAPTPRQGGEAAAELASDFDARWPNHTGEFEEPTRRGHERNGGDSLGGGSKKLGDRGGEGKDACVASDGREGDVQGGGAGSAGMPAATLLAKLRWATVGVQFDWSRRAYDRSLPHQPFPADLAELAAELARPAMRDGQRFLAQAAIINFYGPGDMLGGHQDDMEADLAKPIVSISRDDEPVAMYVRSGDVVLMAGAARDCFHGVPRIFTGDEDEEFPEALTQELSAYHGGALSAYVRKSRINVNVREVG
eukprot:jgi/Mesen1/9518/ME000637S08971